MTYIEFFDKNASKNICASIANIPDRVILVGHNSKVLVRHAERYGNIFLKRGYNVEFICHPIIRYNLQNIVDELSVIVNTYDDCIFDLMGGDELYLTAAGIIYERYRNKRNIQMHRLNLGTGTIVDCDGDGVTIQLNNPLELSVEENIRLYGGDIVYDDIKPGGTYTWDINDEFCTDIRLMWDICRRNAKQWNIFTGILSASDSGCSYGDDGLSLSISASHTGISDFIEKLNRDGLITNCQKSSKRIKFTYKNAQVKKCLTKSGQILELIIYLTASELTDDCGKKIYNDVMTGVIIDWDGKIHTAGGVYDTENEIDVIMMHGFMPIFVSCKNGAIDINELYKLFSVAERFGGEYSKKILIANALDPSEQFGECLMQRARDMKIRVISDIRNLNEDELRKKVGKFYSK